MTKGQRVTIGFVILFLLALALGASGRAFAGIAPPTHPLPAAPSYGWCGTSQNPVTGYWQNVGQCPQPVSVRQLRADIRYPNVPNSGVRRNADLTQFSNIWGASNATMTPFLYPGASGAVVAFTIAKNGCVAAAFKATSARPYVTLRYSTYYSGPSLTMAVSDTPCNFSPPNPNCVSADVDTGESFKKIVTAPYTNGCPVPLNTLRYVNLKMTDPAHAATTISTSNTIGSQP